MVLPGAFFRPALARTTSQIGFKDFALVGWIGMRGPESVAIALALPHLSGTGAGFPARGPIIFVTFGVVFATLVLQGLSINPLTRWLGLQGDLQPEREEAHARHVVASAGLARLEELVGDSDPTSELTNDLRHRSEHRALRWKTRERRLRDGWSPGDDGGVEAPAVGYRQLRAAMIEAERQAVVSLRDQGVISAEVLRRLQRDLDFEAVLLEGPPRPGEQPGASPQAQNE
jgi:CPA1 family monovalent cation:H+ antiporter